MILPETVHEVVEESHVRKASVIKEGTIPVGRRSRKKIIGYGTLVKRNDSCPSTLEMDTGPLPNFRPRTCYASGNFE